MQPLISPVDYESRHNSNRVEIERPIDEDTPLLRRFPLERPRRPSHLTSVVVVSLLLFLLFGVVIGIYLLIVQSQSENILPPVDAPLQLVSRRQWSNKQTQHLLKATPFRTNQAIVVQTDTRACGSTVDCSILLMKMQGTSDVLPYNFLVSSGGRAYEGLGWKGPSKIIPEYPAALVLAFIGNFTEVRPTRPQMEAAKKILAESVSQQHLTPNYVVFGKTTQHKPIYLFASMSKHPKWDSQLTDA